MFSFAMFSYAISSVIGVKKQFDFASSFPFKLSIHCICHQVGFPHWGSRSPGPISPGSSRVAARGPTLEDSRHRGYSWWLWLAVAGCGWVGLGLGLTISLVWWDMVPNFNFPMDLLLILTKVGTVERYWKVFFNRTWNMRSMGPFYE